jgi:hypothetical protein
MPPATSEFYARYQAGTLDMREYVRFASRRHCARHGRGRELAQAQASFMHEVHHCPSLRPQARKRLDRGTPPRPATSC